MFSSRQPTPYNDVNTMLHMHFSQAQAILQEKLVGFYLYGSLSLGDFDPRASDIDFLVVTTEEIFDSLFDALRVMHNKFTAGDHPYARRLEGSYISLAALRRHDPNNCHHPELNSDWPLQIVKHEPNWIIERYIVREHGVVVWGPSPETLIDAISPQELRSAVCQHLRGSWRQETIKPGLWLHSHPHQAFAVLTMCRALYAIYNEGRIVSKPVAAAWAMHTLASRWQTLIERSIQTRLGLDDLDDLPETLEFIRFTVACGDEICRQ